MKNILVVCLIMICSNILLAQNHYSRVKIFLDENTTLQKLMFLGLEVDHGSYQKDKWFVSDLSDIDIEILREYNVPHEIQIADVVRYYIERNNTADPAATTSNRSGSCKPPSPTYITPKGFNFGSMGGYFTYEEAINKIDSLSILYPNIVTIKKPIGSYKTAEDRSIYWLKISDNPNVKEDEPEILFNALHHAREPLSLSQLIFFMYYICENYSINPEIKNLVDQIEMYFVPIVNPDGYIYNFSTNPDGGGFWRKNRRENGGNTFGVDVNRNYGFGWGYNNSGSSANPSSDVYRGPSAFSEPESQALRDFCKEHQFKFAMNYHTYSNLLVYPWGYLGKNAKDSMAFQEISRNLTTFNKFKYGTDLETVGYSTNGSSDDWMYGDTIQKPSIISFTPEVGTSVDGFWPQIDRILPLCNESNYMNITICKYLLKYAKTELVTPRLSNQTNGFIRFNINRLGLKQPYNYSVSLVPINSFTKSVGSSKSYNNLAYATNLTDSIEYNLSSNIVNNTELKFALKVQDGDFIHSDTFNIIYGKIENLINENCNNFNNWNTNGWYIDTTLNNNPSFAENQFGNYPNDYDAKITNRIPFDLTNTLHAELTYRAKWHLENNYDYVKLDISENNGNTWQNLCTPNNQITTNQILDQNEVYTGVASDWVNEIINLDAYIGKKIMLKWEFSSDNGLNFQGFNMDDIVVNKLIDFNIGNNDLKDLTVEISPNPTDNILVIKLLDKESNLSNIRILNALGVKVNEKKNFNQNNDQQILFETSNLPAGVYFVEIISNNKLQTYKIIIEH